MPHPCVPTLLRPVAPHVWEAEHHLLYARDDQAQAYEKLKKNNGYNSFHLSLIQVMRQHASAICEHVSTPFTLIDLGPAYPDKTLPLMRHAYRHGISFDYIPVDINKKWMLTAAEVAKPYARNVRGVQNLFEKCITGLPKDMHPHRFVFIGLTFMNFDPINILNLMKKIAGPGGVVGIAQELLTDSNVIDSIRTHYQSSEFQLLSYGVLANLGVDPDPDDFIYSAIFDRDRNRIEMGFFFRKPCERLGIEAGDRLITIVSHRQPYGKFARLAETQVKRPKIWLSPDRTMALAIGQV